MSAEELATEEAVPEAADETETTTADETDAAAPGTDETEAPAVEETEEEKKAKADADAKKKLPPSLRAAIRAEEKARALRREAEGKVSEAKRLHDAAQAREQQTQAQLRQWQEQVNPKLRELESIKRAAAGGDYTTLVEALGLDPRQLLDGLANEAANPLPEHVRRELAEAKRFREQAKAREEEQGKLQAEEKRQAQLRQQDRDMVVTTIEVAGESSFPGLSKYLGEHGADSLMVEAYQLRDQIVKASGGCTRQQLFQELERRARSHYKLGGVAPKSTTPAQTTGLGKPGASASPAATASGRRTGAVRAGMASESAGVGREMTDDERRAKAIAVLREAARAKKR